MTDIKFTHGELFAGLGGFSQAAHRTGFETIWANEMESYPFSIHKLNFPNTVHIEKPLEEAVSEIIQMPVDVLSAGFPCQPFSYAGPRKKNLDPRSEPIFCLSQILSSLSDRKPKFIILENVKGFFAKDNPVLPALIELLQQYGYSLPVKNMFLASLNTMSTLPQSRVRFVGIAVRKDLYPAFKFSKTYFQQSIPHGFDQFVDFKIDYEEHTIAEDNKYGKLLREKIEEKKKAGEDPQRHMYQIRKTYARVLSKDLCPTLTANMGLGGHNVPFILTNTGTIRRLTPVECIRLQGFDANYTLGELSGWNKIYKAIGNAVAVPMFEPIYREISEYLKLHQLAQEKLIA